MAANELRDYLEMGRYKDGLNKCNKFLKKSPADNRLLYFKANFLYNLSQNDEGNKILDQLCSRTPAITDLNLIAQIDELVSTSVMDEFPRPLSNGPLAGKLWANATTAAGRNGVIAINRKRFASAVNEQRWQDAGSALIALKKADPTNKHYKLAHIAVQQLLSEADKDERVAGMNRTLAFRTLKQTAIEDFSQLRFLMNVYGRQSQRKDMIEVFDSFKSQKDSKFAKQVLTDWPFTRQKIELYIAESKWDELHALCSSLLDESPAESVDGTEQSLRVRDDWTVWNGIVQASSELQKPTDVPAYSPDKGDDSRIKRLQMIAHLQATFLSEKKAENSAQFEKTLQSAKDYFTEWQTYPFCYGDIKDFVDELSFESQADFRKHVSESSKRLSGKAHETEKAKPSELLAAEINSLKFEYRLGIGITKPDPDVIKNFASECIRLMDTCSKNKLSLSDACYLAVSALIRLYELENNITYLFQAAYLLETGPSTEDAHPGKVLLVYLETELGLHSMAMKQYSSLRVREIQQETMAHMLLTRVSINHPWSLDQRGEASLDPYEIVDNALDMFISTDKRLANSQTTLMEKGQCDLVFELQDLRDTLARSFTRRMLILEQCRIARLTENPFHSRVLDIRPSVHEYWTQNLKDSRDYAETFNFDGFGSESTPERRLHSAGKIPKSQWITQAIISEDVWSLLQGHSTVCFKPSTMSEEEAVKLSETSTSELTTWENSLIKPWVQLLQATKSLLATDTKPDTACLDRLVTSLQNLPIADILSTQTPSGLPPSSATLQPYFLVFDLLRSAALFCNVTIDIEKKRRQGTRLPAQPVQKIRDAVAKHYAALQKHAREQKAKVDGRDMVQVLREATTGDAIAEAEKLASGLRTFATRTEASAIDAWDGVLKVKLGLK